VGSLARFNFGGGIPGGLDVDTAGNVYVADTNNSTIRMITPGGTVTTLAGLAGSPGYGDLTGSAARFRTPRGLVVDRTAGLIYVAEAGNATIRKITTAGVVTTVAGVARFFGSADGAAIGTAHFLTLSGLAIDGAGNIYAADANSNNIRLLTPGGVVSTFAGFAGGTGNVDGFGSAARFTNPRGVAVIFPGLTTSLTVSTNDSQGHRRCGHDAGGTE
jgi:sugar lactone lactonase YvrE